MASSVAEPPGELPAIFLPLSCFTSLMFFCPIKKSNGFDDSEEQDFHRPSLYGGADGAGDCAVVVDVAVQNRRAGQVGRHKDDLQVDAFVFEKAAMERGVEREKGDVGRRAAHADFFQRLRMDS